MFCGGHPNMSVHCDAGSCPFNFFVVVFSMRLIPVMSTNPTSPGSAVTVVLGLNAALQKRFVLDDGTSLIPGNVHRAQNVHVGVGGKGQDAAVTLQGLHYTSYRLMQFVGSGAEGDAVWSMLQERFPPEVLDECTVRTHSHMRTCTSIVGATETTELVEPSGTISPEELEQVLDRASRLQADALCIMGSLPPGCPDDTYGELVRRMATTSRTLCLIDSVVGLEPLLQALTEKKCPTILKCNASELCRLANVSKPTSETEGISQDVLVAAIRGFLQRWPCARNALTAVAVTDGAHPAHLAALPVSNCDSEWRLFQLPVARLKNDDDDDCHRAHSSSSSLSSMTPWGQHSWIDPLGSATAASVVAASATTTGATTVNTHVGEKPVTHVYPIGAGDAVAAGTLAAWKALGDRRKDIAATAASIPPSSPTSQHRPGGGGSGTAPSPTGPQTPPPPTVSPLPPLPPTRMHPELHAVLAGNESPMARAILAAFAFGLACGTSSCLHKDNSVVHVNDVLRLYNREGRPIFLASYRL